MAYSLNILSGISPIIYFGLILIGIGIIGIVLSSLWSFLKARKENLELIKKEGVDKDYMNKGGTD